MKAKKNLVTSDHLYEMAKNLKLEKRLHPRAKFPKNDWPDFAGPRVFYGSYNLPVVDLSEGGVCVEDDGDHLALKSGAEFELMLHCSDFEHKVLCRLVAMNLNRRHIQFVEPGVKLKKHLRSWIQSGLRAHWMKQVDRTSMKDHPILWTSIYDDSLTLNTDPRWKFSLCVDDETIYLSDEFWPVSPPGQKPISVEKFDRLLTFLENLSFQDEHSGQIRNSLYILRRRNLE